MKLDKKQIQKVSVIGTGVLIALAAVVGTLYLSVEYAGIMDTVIYAVLFGFGASFIPMAILLGAPSFPRGMKKAFGKLHFVLGQVAFDGSFLVQRRDGWEMCPGTKERVFVDDEWHDIEEGHQKRSVLGWKPFGILRFKDEKTFQEERVDPRNLALTQTDGGQSNVERAGIREVSPDPMVSGDDGYWLIDLKRVFTRGLQKIGDISLIEKAEEITQRKEAKSKRSGGWEPLIGVTIGLIIGVATGYVLLGGV